MTGETENYDRFSVSSETSAATFLMNYTTVPWQSAIGDLSMMNS
jgi:hypothetical protein